MDKASIFAPKSSVHKITGKLGIDNAEFKKTLNIIDHWLKLPNP